MHRTITCITFVLLLAAFVVAIGWLFSSPDFEPAITCITLITAISGLFLDRWLSERERRKQQLVGLVHEVYMNLGVCQDIKRICSIDNSDCPSILPRFYNTTLTTVIASGSFATKADSTLWKLLHSWAQRSIEANTRLAATEMYTLFRPSTATEFKSGLREGKVMILIKEVLIKLTDHLLEAYPKESGITRETMLFGEDGDIEKQSIPEVDGTKKVVANKTG